MSEEITLIEEEIDYSGIINNLLFSSMENSPVRAISYIIYSFFLSEEKIFRKQWGSYLGGLLTVQYGSVMEGGMAIEEHTFLALGFIEAVVIHGNGSKHPTKTRFVIRDAELFDNEFALCTRRQFVAMNIKEKQNIIEENLNHVINAHR